MKFTENKTVTAAETVTITAVKDGVQVNIYIPNKDSLPVILAKDTVLTLSTQSAGETIFYLAQASNALTVTSAKASA